MTIAMSVRNLRTSYNRSSPAVLDYSVDLAVGTLTILLGRNGAGKTSTLRGITGFLPGENGRSSAKLVLFGTPVRHAGPLRLSRLGVELVAERNKVFTGMSVNDQLDLIARRRSHKEEVLEFFPRLQERLGVRAGLLSGGERQMLATALALLRTPRVLLVDELSLGLAPAIVRELMHYLRRLADERGLAILAADQAVTASLTVADVVQVMDNGKIVAEGPLNSLNVDDVLTTYLGRESL